MPKFAVFKKTSRFKGYLLIWRRWVGIRYWLSAEPIAVFFYEIGRSKRRTVGFFSCSKLGSIRRIRHSLCLIYLTVFVAVVSCNNTEGKRMFNEINCISGIFLKILLTMQSVLVKSVNSGKDFNAEVE